MSEVALQSSALQPASGNQGLIRRIAWRNLWRNKRRTWLTAGGIAFATLIVSFSMAVQHGSYGMMIETATGLWEGDIKITHPAYLDDAKLDQTVAASTSLLRRLDLVPGVEFTPRAGAFALVSAEERSFGGFIWGVDFAREQRLFKFFDSIGQGRVPQGPDEVVLGRIMAQNVGVNLGDELVLLGSGKEGGVAALALTVVGIFSSGQAELDRTFLFAELNAVQNAFDLGDETHVIAGRVQQQNQLEAQAETLRTTVGSALKVSTWHSFMPEVVQSIELDRVGGYLMFSAILVLVAFSVVNTFLMIVFERRREFGMLLAIGMQPGLVMRQVLTEAFFMWAVGVALGGLLSFAITGYLMIEGIPLAGLEEVAESFYMADRIYPAATLSAIFTAPLVLLIGTQLAGLIATLRVRRISPVEALRGE